MNIENLKNIIDNIVNKELIEKLSDFLAFAESHNGITFKQENEKIENGFQIKFYWEKGENTINSRDGDGHMKFNLKDISFFLPVDLIKLQEAYDTLPDEEKAPAHYEISVNDMQCMNALLSQFDTVMLNLKQFNGKEDNYTAIARLFNKVRGSFAGMRNGI